MEEVLPFLELTLIKRAAEVNELDGFALFFVIFLPPLWVVTVEEDIEFHEHAKPGAGGEPMRR